MCKVGLKVSLRIDYVDADVHDLLGKIVQESEQVSPLMRGRSKALAGREDGFADLDALVGVERKYHEMIAKWKTQHLPKIALPLTHVNTQTISTFDKLVARMFNDVFKLLRLRVNPEVRYVGKTKPIQLPWMLRPATWWDEGYDSVHEAEEECRRKKEVEKLSRHNEHK